MVLALVIVGDFLYEEVLEMLIEEEVGLSFFL
jgi:hypothetical protein